MTYPTMEEIKSGNPEYASIVIALKDHFLKLVTEISHLARENKFPFKEIAPYLIFSFMDEAVSNYLSYASVVGEEFDADGLKKLLEERIAYWKKMDPLGVIFPKAH